MTMIVYKDERVDIKTAMNDLVNDMLRSGVKNLTPHPEKENVFVSDSGYWEIKRSIINNLFALGYVRYSKTPPHYTIGLIDNGDDNGNSNQ